MSNKSQRGQGLFAAIGLAASFALAGGVPTLLAAINGLSIGFAVGAFLFPEETDVDPLILEGPTVTEGDAIPVCFGIARVNPKITYVDPNGLRLLTKKERGGSGRSEFVFSPMQVILCMSDKVRSIAKSAQGGVNLRTDINHSSMGLIPFEFPKVRIFTSDGEPYLWQMYFIARQDWNLHNEIEGASGLDEIREEIERYETNSAGGYEPVSVTMDSYFKSFPQISWGGQPKDWAAIFNDPDWIPGSLKGEINVAPWPTDISPLKGVLNLASPVWSHGENATSVDRFIAQVENIYPEDVGDVYLLVLTHKLWGMGIDPADINVKTFRKNAKAVHINAEGLSFNGALSTAKTGKSLLEELNSHVGAIIRRDHNGKLEFLPLRSIANNFYTDDEYKTWLAAGADEDNDFTYIPGFPVLFDVYEEDSDVELTVSNQGWGSTVNELLVTFPNKLANYKNTPVPFKNRANFQATGTWITKRASYPLFNSIDQVTVRAQCVLREKSRPGAVIDLELPPRYHRVRVGDGLLVYSEEHGMTGTIFRVMKVEEGELGSGSIKVNGILDVSSLYTDQFMDFSSEVPQQEGVEPESPDDPNDPAAVYAHASHWQHNLAQPDGFWPLINLSTGTINEVVDYDDLLGAVWTSLSPPSSAMIGSGFKPDPLGGLTAQLVKSDTAGDFLYQQIANTGLTDNAPYTFYVAVQKGVISTESKLVIQCEDIGQVVNGKVVVNFDWVTETADPSITGTGIGFRHIPMGDGWHYLEGTIALNAGDLIQVEFQPQTAGGPNFADVVLWRPSLIIGRTALKKMASHIYAAKGTADHVGWTYAMEEGPLSATQGIPQIPVQSKGTTGSTNFSHKFSLIAPVFADEDRYSFPKDNGGLGIYLLQDSFENESLIGVPFFGHRNDNEIETDGYALVIAGRPGENPFVEDNEPAVEILRFGDFNFATGVRTNFLDIGNEDLNNWNRTTNSRVPLLLGGLASPYTGADSYQIGTHGSATDRAEYKEDAMVFTADAEQVASIAWFIPASNPSPTAEISIFDVDNGVDHRAVFDFTTNPFSVTSTSAGASGGIKNIGGGWYELSTHYKTGSDDGLTVGGEQRQMIVRLPKVGGGPFPNKLGNVSGPMMEDGVRIRGEWTTKISSPDKRIFYVAEAQRSCNKERQFHWTEGTEAWVVKLDTPARPNNLPYDIWAHRALAQLETQAEPEAGHHRTRVFAQSILDFGTGEPGTESAQPEDEGLARTFDHVGSSYFQSLEYAETEQPPGMSSIVGRMGDLTEPLWYEYALDQSNNVSPAITSYSTTASATQGANSRPSPFSTDLDGTYLKDNSGSSVNWEHIIPGGVVQNGTLAFSIFVRPEDLSNPPTNSFLEIDQVGGSSSKARVNWSTLANNGSNGTFLIEPVGYDDWVKLSCGIAVTAGQSVTLRFQLDSNASEQKDVMVWGEYCQLGTAYAGPKTNDWILQFAPNDVESGIGQACNNVGGTNCDPSWFFYDRDFLWSTLSTLVSNTVGKYQVSIEAHNEDGSIDLLQNVTTEVVRGDPWPSFTLPQVPAVVEDDPSANKYGTSQIRYKISKKGHSSLGTEITGPQTFATIVGPWPQNID